MVQGGAEMLKSNSNTRGRVIVMRDEHLANERRLLPVGVIAGVEEIPVVFRSFVVVELLAHALFE